MSKEYIDITLFLRLNNERARELQIEALPYATMANLITEIQKK